VKAPQTPIRTPSAGLVVFALWLLVFAASSQIMVISPLLPLVGTSLGIPDHLLGTLVTAYSLMVGLFALVAGPFSDRFGRRRILLIGTGTMTLALLLHTLIVGYFSFVLLRVLAGVAGGILSGAAVSYVGDFFPYERRGWALGWIMSGSAAGQILGIPIGVMLAGAWGFRIPFLLFGGAMAATFLLVFLRLPQPDVERSANPVTLTRAVGNYLALLGRREIAAAAVAFSLMFMGVGLFVVYFPTWLESDIGATPNQIAVLFFCGGIANVLVGPQAGKLSDRIGRKRIVLISCAGLSCLMAMATLVIHSVEAAYLFFFLTMGLVAMRISPFSALLTALAEDRERGILLSLTVALGQVGFAIGGGVAGLLYATSGYATTSRLAGASVLGMGLLVAILVPEPPRKGALHPPPGEEGAGA
jgi:predicted MFS family arabinose efflux permease